MEKEELKAILNEVLHENRKIDNETHQIQHQWIEMKMANEQKWYARWEKFQASLIGGIALAILGFLGWIGNIVLNHILHR